MKKGIRYKENVLKKGKTEKQKNRKFRKCITYEWEENYDGKWFNLNNNEGNIERQEKKQIKRKWKISIYESKQKLTGMKLATVYREQIGIILSVQCQVLSEKTKSDEMKNGKLEENIEFQTETIFHLIIR